MKKPEKEVVCSIELDADSMTEIVQDVVNDRIVLQKGINMNAYVVDLGSVFGSGYNGTAIVIADNEHAAARQVNEEFGSTIMIGHRNRGQHTNRERQCRANDCERIDLTRPDIRVFQD
jgi:hypothetical protein